MASDARTQYLQQAREYHGQQKFVDMCNCMLKVVDNAHEQLVPEERHMLYIAYKCVVGQQRHILKHDPGNQQATNDINSFCGELINVLTQRLIPNAERDTEALAFYNKVMGDFYRYLDAVGPSNTWKENANSAYEMAQHYGQNLPVTHPLRLNAALNHGVLYHEALRNTEKAYATTKAAVDAAVPVLGGLAEQERSEAQFVINLMKDNLCAWEKELGIGSGGDQYRGGGVPAVRSATTVTHAQQAPPSGHNSFHFSNTSTRGNHAGINAGFTPAHTPAYGPSGNRVPHY